MKAQVSLVRCEDYTQERVYQALSCCLELIGGLERVVRKDDKVLIKVNMLSAKPPERAVTTHPVVVSSLIELVKKVGGVPLVGDSPGGVARGLEKYWEETGIGKAAFESGAQMINFETSGIVPRRWERGEKAKVFYVAKPVLAADVVITVPKLKTHGNQLFTGAIKNQLGVIPGFHKGELHREFPHPDDFGQMLADLLSLIRPKLAVMDAVVGMEGDGPAQGNPRKIGVLLASFDPVALDVVASLIIGFDPPEIPAIRAAIKLGLGAGELERIEVLGEDLETMRIEDFALPSNAFLRRIPRSISKTIAKLVWLRPVVRDRCIGCGLCVANCPPRAMALVDGRPLIDYKNCIKCLCCQELCPQGAVDLKKSLLARFFID